MKKQSKLHTSFLKFIMEKYDKNQEFSDEETNLSNKGIIDEMDEFDRIINNNDEEEKEEIQDEEETLENDDESIDDLIKEYRLLEKKYKMKTNGSIRNKRK